MVSCFIIFDGGAAGKTAILTFKAGATGVFSTYTQSDTLSSYGSVTLSIPYSNSVSQTFAIFGSSNGNLALISSKIFLVRIA